MIRKIVVSGDPKLRKISKPVTKMDKKVVSLIKDLKETLQAQKDPEGVGLAAPQIGVNLRVFVMQHKGTIREMVNPELIEVDKNVSTASINKEKILEGCLSLVDFYGPLQRSKKVKIRFQNESGQYQEETFSGFSAHIIQHEIDHLNGILFVDHLIEQKKPLYKLNKNDEWEEISLT